VTAPAPHGLSKFGKYHVLGRIAQGGMAEVFKVKTVGLAGFEKVQVLKRILPAHAKNPRFIRSFIDEARIAVSLNHRNIVQVFDFGRFDDELFLTMELVEGINLRDAFQTASRHGSKIPLALSCYALAEVAAGLDYAHRRRDTEGRPLSIVHCDVSPQNIALSWEGYVKILDFGVARASFAAGERGRLRGKPRYMAPEQTKGELPTAETDVFGLAVVAWEVLCGRALFEGPDVDSILKKIQRLEIPDPREHVPELPASLVEALLRALGRHPPARGTAAELGGAFAQAMKQLDPGTGSRPLARWLGELFVDDPRYPKPPEPEPEAPPAPAAPAPHPMQATMPVRRSRASSATANLRPQDPEESVSVPGGTVPERRPEAGLSSSSSISLHSVSQSHSHSHSLILEPEAEPELLDEKRRVVALACHLGGGTTERRTEAAAMLAGIAYKFGALAQEDGGTTEEGETWVSVFFGLELAGEDDVASALRWSIAAVEAMREGDIAVRIGIRQGIVARRRDPDGGPASFQLLGDTWDEARSLALDAPPGRALYGGALGRLAASGFTLRETGPMRRRARRIRVLELVGVRSPSERSEEARATRGAFVGRDAELSALRDVWATAVTRDERLVCAVVGDAGIGKSRLVAEFAARATGQRGEVQLDARPVTWRLVSAVPGGDATPFQAVLDLLSQEVGLPAGRGPTARARLVERLGALAEHLGNRPEDTEEILAAVTDALELRDGAALGERVSSLRDRMLFALAILRERMDTLPRLTVVDDWHWLDAPSAEVLAVHFAQQTPGAELILVTSRPPSADAPPIPDAASPVIRLKELGLEDGEELLRERLGARADAETVSLVLRRSGGNPLFLLELASALDDLAELPETARGVITARVDRLPTGAKAALQYAAVLGPVLRARVLEELLGKGAPRHVTALEQAGILSRIGKDSPDGDLVFRHGLLQEVVYDALSGAARREAHRRVGRLLSEHYEAGRVKSPAVVARHLELGGEAARAAIYWLRAGRLGLAAYDPQSAVAAFTRALELGGWGQSGGSPEREREALSGRAEARAQTGDHEGTRRDLEALGRLAGGDDRRLGDVWLRTAGLQLRLGDLPGALTAAESAERSAERAGDERLRGESLRTKAEVYEQLAELDRALDAASRAVDIFRRIGQTGGETRALVAIGRIHLAASRLDAALHHYVPALDRVKKSGDPWLERIIRNNLGVIYLYRGDLREAMGNARRALEICRRLGDRTREGDNAALVGAICLQLGLYDDAAQWLGQGLSIHAQTGSRVSRADALVHAGLREIVAGDLELGLAHLEESSQIAAELKARQILAYAEAQLALGRIRRRAPGDLARAERHALTAIEVARDARLPGAEILGLERLALALLESGNAAAALAPSREAVALLGRIETVEWPEEEIWFTHYRVLAELGDRGAQEWLDRAHASFVAKRDKLADPEWQATFSDRVPLHRQIRLEKQRIRRG
jgi:eukaryotic-like serine/threonine-protein kinase